jgi:agmatine deiminase
MRALSAYALGFCLAPLLAAAPSAAQEGPGGGAWNEALHGPLPRWREGGTPPVDPAQPLWPYAVHAQPAPEMPPATGWIESPPEYSPSAGVLFRYSTSSWSSLVTALVASLTGDPAHDELAYVVVSSTSQQASATSAFTAAGADLSKVRFLLQPTDSIWIRDYGPHFMWQSSTQAIADSHYYPTRPQDNFIPTMVATEELIVPPYAMGLYYSGGNFQPGRERSAITTSLVFTDNPSLSQQQIADLYSAYQGIDTLHVFPRLPGYVDGTGHIDMWMYLVDARNVIVSQFKPGSDPTAIAITDNGAAYMASLGYQVFRVPAWNVGSVHYTYTNAYRVNDRIYVPVYGQAKPAYLPDDQQALAAWAAAAGPGVAIVAFDCNSIIPAAGALHCIVMQVPRVVDGVPAVHVCSPSGGELAAIGSSRELRWSASDDVEVRAIDLAYSTDGGSSFPHLIASGLPDLGSFTWKLPFTPALNAKLRVTARDADGNWSEALSEQGFAIVPARRRVYDFSAGAGVDKWAWGWQTLDWSAVDGVRYPVGNELSPAAYAALASSNATGGDPDPNRYISPIPSSSSESTHVFEFTLAEDPARLVDIELAWEGYGDACLQVEVYLWDQLAGNWSDANGSFGSDAYLANWAGNRDERLEAHVRKDFARYVDASGRLTFLVYAERPGQETFHDYVAVTTTYRGP